MRKSNTPTNTAPAEKAPGYIGPFVITRAAWNDKGDRCRFSINFPDISLSIYGARLMYNKSTSEPFISFPAYKGSDGKYYNHCYIALADELVQGIVDDLEAR